MIITNVTTIEQTIAQACHDAARRREDVQEIVVTKKRTQGEIQEMYDLGFRHFAENRVDKLLMRQQEFPQEDIVWHLIGPLQSRKVKDIINKVEYFHALDRLSIAKEINKRAEHCVKCFLEVNISGEVTKHGFSADEVGDVLTQLQQYEHIEVIGLMTMAPFEATKEEIDSYFSQLKALRDNIMKSQANSSCKYLSMGMSNDYPLAIKAGATHIRIGTAWFK
ncbi:hypothetical protein SAMN05421767_10537 [Granulicatella balaenopterae]|uniref:Pyridoxal phosphate homeostasis protein n=1 Tax=Granulicatella balaenopterae TaxID=137733 RepID=A0A1H9IC74_9LACT|nr:YggS family pyridoxal phosphate-dependent enzyme [Granulicatella balaenopterae]SEQ72150.1 hypothetical protein SAMN05421767_10537 [Granulicatella balaenopterae]